MVTAGATMVGIGVLLDGELDGAEQPTTQAQAHAHAMHNSSLARGWSYGVSTRTPANGRALCFF